MKQNISGGVAVVIIIIVVVVALVFGWRHYAGGSDGDVTQETINRYQDMAKQNAKGGTGQMTHGAPANASTNTPH